MDDPHRTAIRDFEVSGPRPPSPGGTVAVLLHGRGSDMHDLQGLRPLLPASWTLVTPRAPWPGGPWGYGPGWAWYRYVADDRVSPETLASSLAALDAFLEGLPERLGGAVDGLVLGGFSQGGTTSLAYAAAHPERVGAVLNFSGFLAHGVEIPAGASMPEVYWGHGLHDPAIPHGLAIRGREKLRAAGMTVTASDFPIGHGIVPAEVEEAVRFVERALSARERGPRTP